MSSKNKFGFFSICLLGINAIIGSGIFLLPGKIAREVGMWSIAVILFDALLVFLLALCFAEAGGFFKENGAAYVYAREAFGEFVGFEVGFMKWIIMCIAWAAMAVAFYTALAAEFPILKTTLWKNVIAASMLTILTVMNLLGVRVSKILNNTITLAKLLPMVFFILVGIFYIKGSNFSPMEAVPPVAFTSFGSAALIAFYAFIGFENIGVAAEDMDRPERNVPLAIVVVVSIVSLIYLLIVVVSIGILGSSLPYSDAPVAEAAGAFLGPIAKAIVSAGTLVSIGGLSLTSAFFVPRSSVALADNGFLPSIMKKRSKNDVPYVAAIVSGIFTILICLSGSFEQLLAISVVSRFVQCVPTCLSIIVFRRQRREGTFKIPFGWTVPILAVILSCYLLYSSELKEILLGLGGLVVGVLFYFIMKARRKEA